MVFLTRSKNADPICLAQDFGESPSETMSKMDLKALMLASKGYNEYEAKDLLEAIVADREKLEQKLENENKLKLQLEKEEREFQLRREQEEREFQLRREQEEREFQLQKEGKRTRISVTKRGKTNANFN
ncbi:hypothetical protein AVEN_108393-1 [Araneus ventricosus]|uniref:Uncharacterized protein n=1 Tax=Araneus ventricosus TaxID=182803 RepID=A0A4Y2CV90_ARAVE|nr:hypothetical protein AVEN_108393-1 [Araneus ventricosus]